MLVLVLRLILRDKSGKQHCLSFIGSKLGVEIFLKKRDYQERMRWNRGLRHLCILCLVVSKKLYEKFFCFLIAFLVIKSILKAQFSFIPWLLNFSDLPSWLKFEENIHTKAIVKLSREEHPLIGGKVPTFYSLRWAHLSLA